MTEDLVVNYSPVSSMHRTFKGLREVLSIEKSITCGVFISEEHLIRHKIL